MSGRESRAALALLSRRWPPGAGEWQMLPTPAPDVCTPPQTSGGELLNRRREVGARGVLARCALGNLQKSRDLSKLCKGGVHAAGRYRSRTTRLGCAAVMREKSCHGRVRLVAEPMLWAIAAPRVTRALDMRVRLAWGWVRAQGYDACCHARGKVQVGSATERLLLHRADTVQNL